MGAGLHKGPAGKEVVFWLDAGGLNTHVSSTPPSKRDSKRKKDTKHRAERRAGASQDESPGEGRATTSRLADTGGLGEQPG